MKLNYIKCLFHTISKKNNQFVSQNLFMVWFGRLFVYFFNQDFPYVDLVVKIHFNKLKIHSLHLSE